VWLALAWSLMTATVTLLPGSTIDQLNLWGILSFDKAGHFMLYCIYTILLINAFRSGQKKSYVSSKILVFSFLIATCFGLVLEMIQSKIPGRNFDFIDMIANIAGSIFGLSAITFFIKFKLYS
jgi:VanZ family protein